MRPKTLVIGASPVLIGTVLAPKINWLTFAAVLFCALAIQIGTNFANDYYGHLLGEDTKNRKGPRRLIGAGKISSKAMRRAIILAFAFGGCTALYLMAVGGCFFGVLYALAVIFGIAYSRGKCSLARIGLADLVVFLFFGPVATAATYFLQTGYTTWLAGLAPGLLPVAVLTANNLRDRHEDASTGKKTLVVRFGKRFGYIEYYTCLIGGVLSVLLIGELNLLICLGALVFALQPPNLLAAAKTSIVYTVLFCIGSLI